MDVSKALLLSLSLCLLFLSHPSVAERNIHERQQRGQQWRHDCDIEQLKALEPTRRLEAEAGVVEFWEPNDKQFRCAGVAVIRHVIEPRGLLLPSFTNAPYLTVVVQGRGVQGVIVPGCPESFESGGRLEGDRHQRVFRIQEGSVIGSPAGIVQWTYNDGDSPIVSVTMLDLTNSENQLDLFARSFYLAGNPQGGERSPREISGNNIFLGFNDELLAKAFNVDTETVRRVKGENDERGCIVRIDQDMELLSPDWEKEEETRRRLNNGLEETFCSMRFTHIIDHGSETDVYSRHGGRISIVNGHKFPLLQHLQLSVEGVMLYPNAMMTPHWNMDAHSIMYIRKGRGRIQVAQENGRLVFDGQVQEGQVLVVPQNFVVVKKAGEQEGLQWLAFKTNDNAMVSPLAGRISAIRAMPEEVVMNSYGLSRDDARRLKYGRQEVSVFRPHLGRSLEGILYLLT